MQVTADAKTLMEQASMTADTYMQEAVRRIDRQFGSGYAAEHPDLVGVFIQAAATDFATAMNAKVIESAAERIAQALESGAAGEP
jgi:hypothetical protein